MRKRLFRASLAALALAALIGAARADGELQVVDGPYPWEPMCPGSHGVSLATATTLAAASMLPTGRPNGSRSCVATNVSARQCVVVAKTAIVYYTLDGSTTATSSASALQVGAALSLVGYAEISAAQFYSATGVLDVECYR